MLSKWYFITYVIELKSNEGSTYDYRNCQIQFEGYIESVDDIRKAEDKLLREYLSTPGNYNGEVSHKITILNYKIM